MANDEQRLMRFVRVDPETGCWLWQGTKNRAGYGRAWLKGASRPAHRAMWTILVGPIPAGLVLDHRCEEPSCVNPRHLRAVSQKENVLAGHNPVARNARRQECKRGHPLTGDNLVSRVRGLHVHRECKTCRTQAGRRKRQKGRAT